MTKKGKQPLNPAAMFLVVGLGFVTGAVIGSAGNIHTSIFGGIAGATIFYLQVVE